MLAEMPRSIQMEILDVMKKEIRTLLEAEAVVMMRLIAKLKNNHTSIT